MEKNAFFFIVQEKKTFYLAGAEISIKKTCNQTLIEPNLLNDFFFSCKKFIDAWRRGGINFHVRLSILQRLQQFIFSHEIV